MKKQFRLFNILWLLLALFIIFIDQLTKNLVLTHLHLFQGIKVTSFFNILLSFNSGAAFGLFNRAGSWQPWLFGFIAVTVSLVLIVMLLRQPRGQLMTSISLSFILGGALGNFIDRLNYGYVIDFLHFHIDHWSWPIFNVADSMICIGAGLLVLGMVMRA